MPRTGARTEERAQQTAVQRRRAMPTPGCSSAVVHPEPLRAAGRHRGGREDRPRPPPDAHVREARRRGHRLDRVAPAATRRIPVVWMQHDGDARARSRRASRTGAKSPSTIARSSRGTPGKSAIRTAPSSSSSPGAVPFGLCSTLAPSGTRYWPLLSAGTRACPAVRNRASTSARASASSTSVRPRWAATADLVRSSGVGPRPPVTSTRAADAIAASSASRMCPSSSPTVNRRTTRIPRPESMRPSQAALVSTVSP